MQMRKLELRIPAFIYILCKSFISLQCKFDESLCYRG